MRRALLVLGLLTGCGRVAFDPSGDARASADDAAIDAPAFFSCAQANAEGMPCDDANVCTNESHCEGGVCVATTPMATCTVTSSEMDFEETQGVGGWYYGYWTAESDPTYEPATDFVEATWGGSAYETASTTFTYIAWWGAHPATNPLEYAIRRWVSSVHGPAVIDVHVGKSDVGCGDGVDAQLLIDGVSTWTQTIAFDDAAGVDATIPVTLTLGTYVEYVLGPGGPSDSCDSTDTSFVVRSP